MSNRVQLTPEQAEAMLPDGNYIHTFISSRPGMMLGADWERAEILKRFADKEQQPPELAGPMAQALDHGICVWQSDHWLFVQTKSKNDTGTAQG